MTGILVTPPSSGSGSATPQGVGIYGDGSDGNVTVSTTVTLTRDMFYDTLTVASGGVLKPNGYRIFCKTACVVQAGGKISADGNPGSNQAGGAGTGNNQASLGYTSFASTNGAAGAGAAGTAQANSMGGSGGAGGSGLAGANAGGAGGVASAPAATLGSPTIRSVPQVILGMMIAQSGVNLQTVNASVMGGAHGGPGAGDGVNFGGGPGAGGHILGLYAKAVTNAGTVSADGGAGVKNGVVGNNGGGGGGGGGVVFCVCDTFAGTQPTASGGAGGGANGTGVAGTAGAAGRVILLAGSVS